MIRVTVVGIEWGPDPVLADKKKNVSRALVLSIVAPSSFPFKAGDQKRIIIIK